MCRVTRWCCGFLRRRLRWLRSDAEINYGCGGIPSTKGIEYTAILLVETSKLRLQVDFGGRNRRYGYFPSAPSIAFDAAGRRGVREYADSDCGIQPEHAVYLEDWS